MKSSFKQMVIRIIFIAIIVTIIGIYVYSSYFHYYEGRNNEQNQNARLLYDIVETALYETSQTKNNFIISSDENISDAYSDSEKEVYNKINELSMHYNMNLENNVYYIEIRDGQLYKVIYSSWEYSGYTGSFPNYNLTCNPYHIIVHNAYNDFIAYNTDTS